jgi:hypothetical protein
MFASRSPLPPLALGAALLVGCGATAPPSPTICDGISSEMGGCDPDRPIYAGETCEEIGREYGTQVDRLSLAIFNGPDDPEGSSAVRFRQVNTVAAVLANKRLRDLGIVDECDADEFMAAAEQQFSMEFHDQAGIYLYDGPPQPYEAWRAETYDLIAGLIDEEEDLPYAGATP